MAGPIGFGVFKALNKNRRAQSSAPRSAGQGWGYFVAITLLLSWLTAGLVAAPALDQDEPMMSRLLSASLFYAATMGWQPLVAAWLAKHWRDTPSELNGGMRWPRARYVALALGIAVGLAAAAILVARLVGEPAEGLSLHLSSDSALAATGVLAVLCCQALTEEYGWRGTPMAYAIERWGVRAGLVVHGLVWGAWYAPLLLFVGTPASLAAAGGFVVTCLLLGIVFGWLRLRSRSIAPSAIANALLTIVAGLPLLVQEGSTGIRDAVFRWPGLPVLAALAVLLLVIKPLPASPSQYPSRSAP